MSYLLIDSAESFLFNWYSGVYQLLHLCFCILLNSSSSVFSTKHERLVVVLQWCYTTVFREAIYTMWSIYQLPGALPVTLDSGLSSELGPGAANKWMPQELRGGQGPISNVISDYAI